MSRRYRNHMSRFKDVITYHVYEDSQLKSSYVGNKEAALHFADSLEGEVEIKKSRIQIPIDK